MTLAFAALFLPVSRARGTEVAPIISTSPDRFRPGPARQLIRLASLVLLRRNRLVCRDIFMFSILMPSPENAGLLIR